MSPLPSGAAPEEGLQGQEAEDNLLPLTDSAARGAWCAGGGGGDVVCLMVLWCPVVLWCCGVVWCGD